MSGSLQIHAPHLVICKINKLYVTVHVNICPMFADAVVLNEIKVIFKEMFRISN